MTRYFIELSYNGTRYHGWQRQPNGITVQEVLETNFSKLLKKFTGITGAGRTDAGVHASHYYAHFDTERENLHLDLEFLLTLNRMLPQDIALHAIRAVSPGAHARFDALSRTYQYHILREKNPFKSEFSWLQRTPLNLEKMNQASSLFLGKHDFTSFTKLHSNTKTHDCTLSEARWEQIDDCFVFTVRADRFLRNMVRALVGTLFDLGRGRLTPEDIIKIMEEKNRCAAGVSVPASGLFLTGIEYPGGYFLS